MAGGGKGGGGQPQNQMMGMGQGKGGGGMPQNQYANTAAGQAGAQPALDPQQMQQRQQQMQQMMQQRQQMMDQRRNFMNMNNPAGMPGEVPPPVGGGINSLYGQTGPAGAAPLDLGDPGVTGTGANPAVPTPANFAASAAPGGMAPPGWGGGMGRGMGRFGGYGGFGGSRGMMGMMGGWGGRGQMANGGIVTLAGGGMLGEPVSRGGVTYAPAMANPVPAVPVAAPPAAVVSTPKIAWNPVSTPGSGGGGSMFSGINVAQIAQPEKWSGPTTTQAIWQPPSKADTSGSGDNYKLTGAQTLGLMMGGKPKNLGISEAQWKSYQQTPVTVGNAGKYGGGKGGYSGRYK